MFQTSAEYILKNSLTSEQATKIVQHQNGYNKMDISIWRSKRSNAVYHQIKSFNKLALNMVAASNEKNSCIEEKDLTLEMEDEEVNDDTSDRDSDDEESKNNSDSDYCVEQEIAPMNKESVESSKTKNKKIAKELTKKQAKNNKTNSRKRRLRTQEYVDEALSFVVIDANNTNNKRQKTNQSHETKNSKRGRPRRQNK